MPIRTFDQQGTVDARKRGPICPQSNPPWASIAFSNSTATEAEDCLLLDIVTPMVPASDKLPVMVQIHGGGQSLCALQNAFAIT